jgi:hypothetical protein
MTEPVMMGPVMPVPAVAAAGGIPGQSESA